MAKENKSRQEIRLDQSYRERYDLLKKGIPSWIKIPPFEAFIKSSLPYQLKKGQKEVVYARSLTLKREWSKEFWRKKTEKLGLTPTEKRDFQVVVIPPSREKNGDKDFSKKFYADLKTNRLGKYSVAKYIRGKRYRGDPYESRHSIENFKSVISVYIVASPLSKGDFADINFVAEQYLMNGAKEVILVAPFIADQRDDKNVKKTKQGEPFEYNGRIIKIKAWMQSLAPFISKIITFETHSSATQSFAALAGIPLAPISYEEELIGQISHRLKKKNFDPTKWKVVRPDLGRNLVATNIQQFFGIEGVNIDQVRNSDTLGKEAETLPDELKRKLKGTNVILYDDEAGTFGTIKNVAKQLIPAEVKSINIFLGHARLQQGWTANLKWIIEKCRKNNISLKVYVTDSRVPVGSLRHFMDKYPDKIKILSVAKKTRNVIEANVKGVDFWTETNFKGINFERGLLQYIKDGDNN